MVSFTPFPTAVLAEYLGKAGAQAMAIFGFNYFMMAVASYCICAYPYRKHLVNPESREFFHCIQLTYAYSIIYTLIAFIACFIYIPPAILLYMGLFFAFAFPKEFAMLLLKRKQRKIKCTIPHPSLAED